MRGEGCRLYDAEGHSFLDLMGGIATATLGHAHPKLRAALEAQAALLRAKLTESRQLVRLIRYAHNSLKSPTLR